MPIVEQRGITLVGVTVTNLERTDAAHQLGLFDQEEEMP